MDINTLRTKLSSKQDWIRHKYNVYEMKSQPFDPSPVIPGREKVSYNSQLGWCAKAVDDLANRLTIDSFENDNFNMWNLYQLNSPDILFDSAIKSALISACSFVYVSADEDGEVRLQVIDGRAATGIMDPVTHLLQYGYAVFDNDEYGNPTVEAYFTPEETVIYNMKDHSESHIANPTGYPLLVPILYRPDSGNRIFGQSRISKDLIDIQNKARWTITCLEVAREFGAFPQKYVVGLSQDAEFDSLKNAYKQMLAIDKDGDGDKPTVGQFAQTSLTGYLELLREYKAQFDLLAGMDSHEALEIIAKKAQDTFGACFLNVGLVAACLRDETHYRRNQIYDTRIIWRPVYNIDNSAISTFGDGILKINQAIPDAIDAKAIRQLTGLPIEG